MKMHKESEPMKALRRLALGYPEAEEGIACEGTPVEKRTVKVRNKAFLFLGETEAMVKLRESLAEATRLASREPGRCRVGAHGWVTVTIQNDDTTPPGLLERWIDESYRLIAPGTLVELLPARSPPTGKPREVGKKKAPKKNTKKRTRK